MITILKHTNVKVTFEKTDRDEPWFNDNYFKEYLLLILDRPTEDTIEHIQFEDGKYIGSLLHVYLKPANWNEEEMPSTEGKSVGRVPAGYQRWPKDWNAQYNMLLMDGVTCKQCAHCLRCTTMFDQKETATSCQFHPNRFTAKLQEYELVPKTQKA